MNYKNRKKREFITITFYNQVVDLPNKDPLVQYMNDLNKHLYHYLINQINAIRKLIVIYIIMNQNR